MSTFHPFPRLPTELRLRIWSLTAFPRMIHVKRQCVGAYVEFGLQYMATSTPYPAVVQVCQESRQHAPYQRAFTTGANPRYIWVNFESDLICNDDSRDPLNLEPHEQDIQRLRFSINDELAYDYITNYGNQGFKKITNIKEIYIAVDREIAGFSIEFLAATVNKHECFNGNDDKVKFLDVGSGYMMDANQLRIFSDWKNYYSFDTHGRANVDTFEGAVRFLRLLGTILTLSELHALDDEDTKFKKDQKLLKRKYRREVE
ncbi:hypothetical protein T069G_04759 [Trichoderma breve]|uniref:2EXR domain-containing protein n=1 Tax=Trichoderma breve TaxID=2034170 RepID=A0A9W9BH96_9HYPO|nr:hypothetical protein T069G_04759 [Trichoderma breve]KAJ4859771.1 hypothetical protein T069G_04759 [Trichoderma breve]